MIIIIIFNADDYYMYAIMMMFLSVAAPETNITKFMQANLSSDAHCMCVNKNSAATSAAPIEVICNFGSLRVARTEIILKCARFNDKAFIYGFCLS